MSCEYCNMSQIWTKALSKRKYYIFFWIYILMRELIFLYIWNQCIFCEFCWYSWPCYPNEQVLSFLPSSICTNQLNQHPKPILLATWNCTILHANNSGFSCTQWCFSSSDETVTLCVGPGSVSTNIGLLLL